MERGGKQGSQIIYEIANVVRGESKATIILIIYHHLR